MDKPPESNNQYSQYLAFCALERKYDRLEEDFAKCGILMQKDRLKIDALQKMVAIYREISEAYIEAHESEKGDQFWTSPLGERLSELYQKIGDMGAKEKTAT